MCKYALNALIKQTIIFHPRSRVCELHHNDHKGLNAESILQPQKNDGYPCYRDLNWCTCLLTYSRQVGMINKTRFHCMIRIDEVSSTLTNHGQWVDNETNGYQPSGLNKEIVYILHKVILCLIVRILFVRYLNCIQWPSHLLHCCAFQYNNKKENPVDYNENVFLRVRKK